MCTSATDFTMVGIVVFFFAKLVGIIVNVLIDYSEFLLDSSLSVDWL